MEPAKVSSKIIVKAVVIRPDGRVLVLRRSPDDPDSPGRLDLPGGGIEADESYLQAVSREISEEAGIKITTEPVLAYTFTRYDDSSDTTMIRMLYVVHVTNPTVRLSHEHDAYWWHTPEELTTLFAKISWGQAIRFLYEHRIIVAH